MKKLLLFFGLICMINLTFAQETVIIHQNGHDFQVSAVRTTTDYPAENIRFWVGDGSNSIVATFKWCLDEESGLGIAYGYRWNGTASIEDMLTAIAAADSRFTVTFSGSMVDQCTYSDGIYNLSLAVPGYCMYMMGTTFPSGIQDALIPNTTFEFEEWGDCYPFPATTPIIPVEDPNAPVPEESTIAFSEILYWVGTGSNEAVLAVNWADTALAWGYKWNGTATVADMMADIATADPRFSYELGDWGLDDILFVVAEGDTLRKVPYSYWESKNNGMMDAGMSQTLANGDFEKWAEPAAGVIVDSMEYDGYWYYTYVYPMTINPVSVPTNVSIDNHEISRVHAYPNPCTSTLYIENENAERIELYNTNGKLLETIENHDSQVILNMQQYPAGLYLLKVGNGVEKVLKK